MSSWRMKPKEFLDFFIHSFIHPWYKGRGEKEREGGGFSRRGFWLALLNFFRGSLLLFRFYTSSCQVLYHYFETFYSTVRINILIIANLLLFTITVFELL